jgi:hypothetical protein
VTDNEAVELAQAKATVLRTPTYVANGLSKAAASHGRCLLIGCVRSLAPRIEQPATISPTRRTKRHHHNLCTLTKIKLPTRPPRPCLTALASPLLFLQPVGLFQVPNQAKTVNSFRPRCVYAFCRTDDLHKEAHAHVSR